MKRKTTLWASLFTVAALATGFGFAPAISHAANPMQPTVQIADGDEATPAPAAYQSDSNPNTKRIYLFTTDFPPASFGQYPSPPIKETRFWQDVDKEMTAGQRLSLTDDPTQADYRVELRCSGILNCSKLVVDLKSPKRDVLATFPIIHINSYGGFGSPNLEKVAKVLNEELIHHIDLLGQGGYGNFPANAKIQATPPKK